ncbi:MAG: VOC family protein, partial [Thiomonas delicata]
MRRRSCRSAAKQAHPSPDQESSMPAITPMLWFDGQAEEAARFYVSIFPNSRIARIHRYPDAGREVHGHAAGAV